MRASELRVGRMYAFPTNPGPWYRYAVPARVMAHAPRNRVLVLFPDGVPASPTRGELPRAALTAHRIADVARLVVGDRHPFAPGQAEPAPELSETARAITRGWETYPALRSDRAQAIFRRLRPRMLRELARAANPDEALVALDGFLAGLPSGVQIFSLFQANPQLVDLIVREATPIGKPDSLAQVRDHGGRCHGGYCGHVDDGLDPVVVFPEVVEHEVGYLVERLHAVRLVVGFRDEPGVGGLVQFPAAGGEGQRDRIVAVESGGSQRFEPRLDRDGIPRSRCAVT